MRWRIPLLASLALLVAWGCQDTPVEPPPDQTVDSPRFNAGQGPNQGMSLIWTFDQPENDPLPDYFPCFNGGEGEDILSWGHYEFWGRTVGTPSGNFKQHGELRGWENYRGVDTGDLWEGSSLTVPTIFYNTRHSDGHTIVNEPVWNYAENQRTGEVVRIMWNFFLELDEVFEFVRADVKITNCKPWNGQVK